MEEDVAERGTQEFYREQVFRLVKLAGDQANPGTRLELLDIATVFQKLAERAAATVTDLRDVLAKKRG